MDVSMELMQEIRKAVLSVYTTARNGLPATPKTAQELEAIVSVSQASYCNDVMCRMVVDKALDYIADKIGGETL